MISIITILVFTALYSTTGGLRSVVRTDVVQLSIALLGTLAYAFFVVAEVGGLGRLSATIVDTYGAGDVFMAALTLALGQGAGRDEALAQAARASAAQLTRRGGGPR